MPRVVGMPPGQGVEREVVWRRNGRIMGAIALGLILIVLSAIAIWATAEQAR